jgi:hypothetical protein
MLRGDDGYFGTDSNLIADHYPAGTVKKTILADPGIITYDHLIQMIPLQDRIVSDIDIVAYRDISCMEYHYASFKNDIFTDTLQIGWLKFAGAM